ncbi:MAG: M4 family metallopeptidase [Acidobacteriota bacterium]|nr:M4 family metallopeptidase [Acidobacteriota bacterium]
MNGLRRVAGFVSLLIAWSVWAAPAREAERVAVAREHFRAQAATYGLADPDRELRQRSVRSDAQGWTHIRYDQFFEGVRVFEGEAIAHIDPRGNVSVTNAIRGRLRVNTTPRIAEATAIATAVSRVNAHGGTTTRARLEILTVPRAQLVWHVTVLVENEVDEMAQWEYLINAHNGAIALAFESLERAAVPGIAKTMLSGDHAITVDAASDGRYYLRDGTRGNIYTLDMNGTTSAPGPVISSATTVFGDNLQTNCSGQPNRLTAGADAQAALTATWNYLQTAFGRNGIDGNGGQMHARVHYGTCTNNAVWSIACNCASFSDGTTGSYLPFVSIDIVGHEFGHGVMAFEAALTARGEPAALNESQGDIIGTMVEFYVNSAVDLPDYWQGERIVATNYDAAGNYTQKTAVRYLDDPAKDGASPACWSRNLAKINPHNGAGPNNHMFYLLAEGGPSKCNGAAVTGVGRTKAAAIWYKAVADYMISTTDYAGARVACLNAAANLYGSGSPEWNAVNAAYAAVNVR